MASHATLAACEGCGTRLQIPPQYANREGRCRNCGGVVNRQHPQEDADISLAGSGLEDLMAPTKKVSGKKPGKAKLLDWRETLVEAAKWGAIFALVGTVIGAIVGTAWQLLVHGGTVGSVPRSALVMAMFAGNIGGCLGSVWGIIRLNEWGLLGGVVTGLPLGLLGAVVHQVIEQALVFSTSDLPLHMTAMMGAAGGALCGLAVSMLQSED